MSCTKRLMTACSLARCYLQRLLTNLPFRMTFHTEASHGRPNSYGCGFGAGKEKRPSSSSSLTPLCKMRDNNLIHLSTPHLGSDHVYYYLVQEKIDADCHCQAEGSIHGD